LYGHNTGTEFPGGNRTEMFRIKKKPAMRQATGQTSGMGPRMPTSEQCVSEI